MPENYRIPEDPEQIDLLVFDVDGVLIDTSRSFPLAISRAVGQYGDLLGIADWEKPPLEEVQAFKTVSGFNNDWDLAEGLLVYRLSRVLLDVDISLEDFLHSLIQVSGGGLPGVHAWIRSQHQPDAEKVTMFYHPSVIRRLAMEHYAGMEYCELLYGLEPKFEICSGTIQSEEVVVDVDLLQELPGGLGIYTGRNEQELQLALDRIGYGGWQPENLIFDGDSTPIKPNPEPLYQMARRHSAEHMIFVGDSRDDFLTIENYRDRYSTPAAYFVQIGEQAFDEGITVFTDVNALLRILCEQNQNSTRRRP